MRERYGEARAQRVTDVEWLGDVGRAGFVVLMKDKRIRTRPAERRAVVDHAVGCFCIARGGLTGEQMAGAYVAHQRQIERLAEQPGPYVYNVTARGLRRVL
jgi:hypothetical protein